MARVLRAEALPAPKLEDEVWVDLGVCLFNPGNAHERLQNLPIDNVKRMTAYRDRKRVEKYARAMADGTWQINPSSRILLGKDDVLLDGRGRMMAVIVSGATIWSYVSKCDTRETARGLVLDQAVPRDASYMLQQPSRLVQAANVAFPLLHSRAADYAELEPFCEKFRDIYEDLAFDSRRRGLGSSAALTLAAMLCVASRRATAEYLVWVLTLFGRRDPRDLPPLPYSLYRQISKRNMASRDQLVRGFRAFSERNQDLDHVQIKNETTVLDEIRALLRVTVGEWK